MIEAAISYGFTAIGFSDHSYAPEQIDYCMPEDKVQANFDEIKKLEEEYRGKIAVYAGLELDGDSQLPDIDYDFIIASVHEMHYEGKSYPVDFSAEVQLELADHRHQYHHRQYHHHHQYFHRCLLHHHLLRGR